MRWFQNFAIHSGVQGEWDQRVIEETRWHYNAGIEAAGNIRTVIDVGTHIGAFIVHIKSLFPDASVIGIEPAEENHSFALYNTRHLENVTVHNAFCGSYPFGELVYHPERPCNYQVKPASAGVSGMSLEKLMEPFAQVDLLKMDCEGGEYDILPHVQDWSKVRVLIGEYHGARERFEPIYHHLEAFFDMSYVPPFNNHVGFFLGVKRA